MRASKVEVVYLILILLAVLAHLRVGSTYSYWDSQHSPGWRMHHSWDETLNSFRAQSIVERGFKNNPYLTGTPSHLYLILSSFFYQLVPENFPLNNRIVIAQRLMTVICFGLVLLSAYFLLRICFSAHVAFWSWLCFYAGTGSYLSNAFFAKEDSQCQLLVFLVLITWVFFLRKPSFKKLYLSAALIALGALTKQYPLLLTILLIPLTNVLAVKRSTLILHLSGMAALIIAIMTLLEPQYYLSGSEEVFNAGKLLLTDQQSNPDVIKQFQSAATILYQLVIIRYRYLWLTVLVYLCGIYYLKEPSARPTPNHAFLTKHKKWIFGFLILYYGISLYKQSFYASIRYFLISEISTILIFACLLERIFAFVNPARKKLALLFVFIACLGFSFKSGNFNYAFFTSVQAETLREASYSTHDSLASYLDQKESMKKERIYSDWYIVYPEAYDITYVHHVPIGYALSAPVVEDALHFRLLNAPWSTELLSQQKPSWVIKGIPPTEAEGGNCLKLVHEIKRTFPVEYTNYISSLIGFQNTVQQLEDKERLDPRGSSVFVYDAKNCWENRVN